MYLLDVNILISAHRADHPSHETVREWLTGAATEPGGFAIVDVVSSGFVRVCTNPRVFTVPTPIDQAFEFLATLISLPGHSWLDSGPRVHELFRELCVTQKASGDLVPDAYLAAIARKHACTLVSLDRDFARFDGLERMNPAP